MELLYHYSLEKNILDTFSYLNEQNLNKRENLRVLGKVMLLMRHKPSVEPEPDGV